MYVLMNSESKEFYHIPKKIAKLYALFIYLSFMESNYYIFILRGMSAYALQENCTNWL